MENESFVLMVLWPLVWWSLIWKSKALRKQTYSLASSDSIWSGGDDVVASGCGCTLRNRDSSPTFLEGRCFNIKLFSSLKRLTSSFSFYGLGHG